jgi:vacuolar-type H+-ATPase subunit H
MTLNDPTSDIDPTAATTGEELAACLRRLRVRADNISYRELERWGELHNKPLPRTTLLEVLHGRRFPRKSVLLAFVEACGINPATDTRWEKVWNRLNYELNLSDLSASTVPAVEAAEGDGGSDGDERLLPESAMPAEVWEQAQELIQQAQLSASTIVSNARDDARLIIERAREKANEIQSTAEREAEQIRQAAVVRAAQEAEELRERVLRDLAEEVDMLKQQQLRGVKDSKQPPAQGEARFKRWFGR